MRIIRSACTVVFCLFTNCVAIGGEFSVLMDRPTLVGINYGQKAFLDPFRAHGFLRSTIQAIFINTAPMYGHGIKMMITTSRWTARSSIHAMMERLMRSKRIKSSPSTWPTGRMACMMRRRERIS